MTDKIPELAAYAARPEQSLAAHAGGVVDNIHTITPATGTTAYGDEWETVMTTLGWVHDAGKLTTFFQNYVQKGTRSVADRPEYTYHGFLGALLAAHALASQDVSEEMRVAGFYAVAKHHGAIPTLQRAHDDYAGTRNRVDDKYDIVQTQLEDIDTHASDAADALLTTATDGNLEWADIPVDSPELYKKYLPHPSQFDAQFYETVLRAWSTLVCADKLDAATVQPPADTSRPDIERFRTNLAELPEGESPLETELNRLRTAAHEDCYTTLQQAYVAGNRLFTLTLPTGFGKTLTGLRACLELAEQEDSRVIYALPYTSVLDQVDSVCREFLDADPLSGAYTIHHHLADTRTTLNERTDSDAPNTGAEALFAETWQSGLVLTTFTQLFESAAGPRNTQSMKLPALQDSIILLDEPQGLPLDWWNLVGRLVQSLIDEYNATVIAMTATQPQIFEQTPDLPSPISLTDSTEACRAFLRDHPRVEFVLHDSVTNHLTGENPDTVSLDAAALELVQATDTHSNTLAVVNTVQSAATLTETIARTVPESRSALYLAEGLQQFYQEHSDKQESDTTRADAYLNFLAQRATVNGTTTLIAALTTRIRPRDRRLLLAALRRILDDDTSTPFDSCPTITVSTQLIEAGVDISFDRLYRDFAPIPALVQAAGRCNRAFDGETGTVTLWRLASAVEGGAPPSTLIYGQRSLLRPTREALRPLWKEHGRRIDEATLIGPGVDAYYDALHTQRRTKDRTDSLVASFNNGDGDTLRKASLIDDEWETQDAVVLVSDDDMSQFGRYQRDTEEDIGAAREQFTELKPLIVTVPVTDGDEQDEGGDDLAVVDATRVPTDYDIETGRGAILDHAQFMSDW
jgi:CRISPR-associated endonuclease Cas3-HD